MGTEKNTVNVLLIGDNIETRIVFKNALSKLDRFCHIGDYYCLEKAVTNAAKSHETKPDIIFLDTNIDCSDEVRKIRNLDSFKNSSLIVYDSNSVLKDTNAIFSEGADAFINQPYDFSRLKKVISTFVDTHFTSNGFEGNRQTYFL
ncbi:response regulator [Flavobacterium phycosphaerae]|uniref:response regulator n=1 Tax=Flavobacterium phycosphaerae TaxID=2697515 RepID=UPI0013898BEA|nr:response regulator [Flavobacterium phycosphaerae]